MKTPIFTGCATALITPFHPDGSIDFSALRQLVSRQIESGIDALVACGTTGEPSTMSDREWSDVLAAVVDETNGRVPVIAGTGGNATAEVIRSGKEAKALGADAQLCVTPYYNKTTQAGLVAHYEAIASSCDLPLIIYNVPSRTGLNIRPETLLKLCENPYILGIKEASGDAAQAADIRMLCGDFLPIYSGSDELSVQLRAVGSLGTVSVLSNLVPEAMVHITHDPLPAAAQCQIAMMRLIRLLFSEVNPIPIKAAMHAIGLCENVLRLPLVPMSAENEKLLLAEMRRLKIL